MNKNVFRSFRSTSVKLLRKYMMIFISGICMIIMAIFFQDFVTQSNIFDLIENNTHIFILTMGLVFIVVSGTIDFSAASQISLISSIMGVLFVLDYPTPVILIIAFTTGVVCGALNGFLVSYVNVPAFAITLITQNLFKGLSYLISKGAVVTTLPKSIKILTRVLIFGIRADIWQAFLIIIIITFVLRRTYFGKYIEAISENWHVAERAGVDARKINMICFSIGGIVYTVAAIVLVAHQNMTAPASSVGTELFCFIALFSAFPDILLKNKVHSISSINLVFSIFFVLCIDGCIKFYGRYPNLQYLILGVSTIAIFVTSSILNKLHTEWHTERRL